MVNYLKSQDGKRFKAEVLEVYPTEGKAAVMFSWRGQGTRIECVSLYLGPDAKPLTVGMRGWATYHIGVNGSVWGFEPFKNEDANE